MTTDQEIEIMRNIVVTYGKLQSLLHDVDRLVELDVKREMKQRLNGFSNWAESFLEQKTGMFDSEGHEKFTTYTTELDQIGIKFGKSIPPEQLKMED